MTPRAAFVYADVLAEHQLREDHPLVPRRLRLCWELLDAYGVFDGQRVVTVPPRMATEEEVTAFHTREYVAAVRAFSRSDTSAYDPGRFNFTRWGDNPIYEGMYEAALWSTGASLVAAAQVLDGAVAVGAANFSGGLHHAMPGYASGFCVFNDPVIAIQALLRQGKRVAYVDVDAHHGDGVQHAFYDTDQVLTISLHESGLYLVPGTGFVHELGVGRGLGYAVNVPLYPYTEDDTYLWAFRQVVPPLVRAFKPDVLVTQLGIDSHFQDPLTHLCLTSHGFARVVQEFATLGLPWVALGGGGYSLDAVARCWALAFSVMAGVELPNDIPAPFATRYGVRYLHDQQRPEVPEATREQARRFAEDTVAQLQRTVFPLHGLR